MKLSIQTSAHLLPLGRKKFDVLKRISSNSEKTLLTIKYFLYEKRNK